SAVSGSPSRSKSFASRLVCPVESTEALLPRTTDNVSSTVNGAQPLACAALAAAQSAAAASVETRTCLRCRAQAASRGFVIVSVAILVTLQAEAIFMPRSVGHTRATTSGKPVGAAVQPRSSTTPDNRVGAAVQ